MPVGDYRFRTRRVPYENQQKTAGYQDPTLKVGKWELLSVDTGKWVPMGDLLVQTQTPYAKVESCMDQIHAGPPYHTGGPFTKISIEFPPTQVLGQGVYLGQFQRAVWGVGTGILRYTGGFTNPLFQGDSSSYANLNQLLGYTSPLIPSLSGWSSKAYARTRPALEKAGAAVFLAESRDIPRMISTTYDSAAHLAKVWESDFASKGLFNRAEKQMPKKAANEFLNQQFGWAPFINDVQRMLRVYENAAAIKSRLTFENNRPIHRRATLLDDYQETLLASDAGMRVEPAGDYISTLMAGNPSFEVWERKSSLITTSGVFTYYRPEFDATLPDYNSAMSTVNRQLTMYGLRISPSNIYKAIPWTWLIDWFTDFGSVIDRITDWAQDSIAAKYLFLMRHDRREVVLKQYLPFAGVPQTLEFSRITDAKIRRESDSPYGFGLSWDGLTPRQLAILGALGISRRRIV